MEQSASSQAPDETGHESDVEVGVVGNGKDGVRYSISTRSLQNKIGQNLTKCPLHRNAQSMSNKMIGAKSEFPIHKLVYLNTGNFLLKMANSFSEIGDQFLFL